MLKRYVKLLFPWAIVLFLVVIAGCSMVSDGTSMAVPVIRVLEAPAVAGIESVVLSITGPDMDPVSVTYSTLPDRINISVPEGEDRTFTLDINMSSDSPGTIKSFRGTGTADISEDGSEVILDMGISSTKIIVPDAANSRLVQIYDMTGSGWTELKASDLPAIATFYPWDVDFDENGFFYVANNDSTYGNVYMFAAVTDTKPIALFSTTLTAYLAVAVDRANNIVYGADSSGTVHYQGINGVTDSGTFSSSSVTTVLGLSVDTDGNVYISGTDSNSAFMVEKYASKGGDGNSVDDCGIYDNSTMAGDSFFYDGYLYVTSSDGNVYKLDSQDLDNGGAYSVMADVPKIQDSFSGPAGFLATIGGNMMFSDDDGSTDRIISVDLEDTTKWTSYGSKGTGEDQFSLFSGTFYDGGAQ